MNKLQQDDIVIWSKQDEDLIFQPPTVYFSFTQLDSNSEATLMSQVRGKGKLDVVS